MTSRSSTISDHLPESHRAENRIRRLFLGKYDNWMITVPRPGDSEEDDDDSDHQDDYELSHPHVVLLACAVLQQLPVDASPEMRMDTLLELLIMDRRDNEGWMHAIPSEDRLEAIISEADELLSTPSEMRSCVTCRYDTIPLLFRSASANYPCPVCGTLQSAGWPLWMRACQRSIAIWRARYYRSGATLAKLQGVTRPPRHNELPAGTLELAPPGTFDQSVMREICVNRCPICNEKYAPAKDDTQPVPQCQCWFARIHNNGQLIQWPEMWPPDDVDKQLPSIQQAGVVFSGWVPNPSSEAIQAAFGSIGHLANLVYAERFGEHGSAGQLARCIINLSENSHGRSYPLLDHGRYLLPGAGHRVTDWFSADAALLRQETLALAAALRAGIDQLAKDLSE